jgi:hypothetical protein
MRVEARVVGQIEIDHSQYVTLDHIQLHTWSRLHQPQVPKVHCDRFSPRAMSLQWVSN